MARRFAETGFKRLCDGVYRTMRTKLRGKVVKYTDQNDIFKSVDPSTLPNHMLMYIDADVGENGNSNIVKKMTLVGQQLLPALMQAGAGAAINPEAAVRIACKTLEALDMDPLDFLVDYTSPEFKDQAIQSRKNEQEAGEKLKQLEEQVKMLDLAQRQATIDLTNVQARNALQDNTKQLMVALDKSYQEWGKLYIMAAKEGVTPPQQPDITKLLEMAKQFIDTDINVNAAKLNNGVQVPEVQGPAAEMLQQ
jgi:hypothetical protein